MTDKSSRHSEYISALRGIAALSIIMFHVFTLYTFNLGSLASRYIPQLWMAVPLFFILSGYTLCLSSSRRATENLTSFYLKRFFRIAPLFYFMTLICVLWRKTTGVNIELTTILANLFFVFNFVPQNNLFAGIVRASWFIGVLMPIYLIFPFLFRASRTFSRAVGIFFITLIISYSFRLGLYWMITSGMAQQMNLSPDMVETYSLCSLVVSIPYFMIGIIAYHIHGSINDRAKNSAGTILFILAMAAFIVLPNLTDQYMINPFPLKYFMSLFFLPLIFSFIINPGNLIINRVTVFFGKISYSTYLVHVLTIGLLLGVFRKICTFVTYDWPAFICCYFLTVLIVTVISYGTYRFIEIPGKHMGLYLEKSMRAVIPSAFRTKLL